MALNTFKTKKELKDFVQLHLNPKSEFTLKEFKGDQKSISYLRCDDGQCGEQCTFSVRIRAMFVGRAKEKRQRMYSVTLDCPDHHNCGAMALANACEPARKKARKASLPTSGERTDWSTVEKMAVLTEAMQKVEAKKMTQGEAAKNFDIPASILSKTITGQRQLTSKKGRGTIIPQEVEASLERYCLELADAAHGVTVREVAMVAKSVMEVMRPDMTSFKASTTWVSNFIKRHPRISLRRAQALERTRASVLNKDSVEHNFTVLGNAIEICKQNSPGGSLPPNYRLNFDESAATIQAEGKIVLGRAGAKSVHTVCDSARSVNCLTR